MDELLMRLQDYYCNLSILGIGHPECDSGNVKQN